MNPPAPESQFGQALTLRVAGANLYLDHETCARFLPDAQAVALLKRDGQVLIVPLAAGSAGGLLLKVRNARGDRVVHAQEFFRSQGLLEDFEQRSFELRWSDESAALVVAGIPNAVQ